MLTYEKLVELIDDYHGNRTAGSVEENISLKSTAGDFFTYSITVWDNKKEKGTRTMYGTISHNSVDTVWINSEAIHVT